MTEIKIDKTTLPNDGQKVKWKTYDDINNETWKEGIFDEQEGMFCVGFNDTTDRWDTIFDVHHWEELT